MKHFYYCDLNLAKVGIEFFFFFLIGERRARPRVPSGLEPGPVAAPRTRAHSLLSHDCSGARPHPKGKALNQSLQPRGASRELPV